MRLNAPLTNSISDFLLMVCTRGQSATTHTAHSHPLQTYLDFLVVLFVNDVDGLLDVSQHEVAVAVISLCLAGERCKC